MKFIHSRFSRSRNLIFSAHHHVLETEYKNVLSLLSFECTRMYKNVLSLRDVKRSGKRAHVLTDASAVIRTFRRARRRSYLFSSRTTTMPAVRTRIIAPGGCLDRGSMTILQLTKLQFSKM